MPAAARAKGPAVGKGVHGLLIDADGKTPRSIGLGSGPESEETAGKLRAVIEPRDAAIAGHDDGLRRLYDGSLIAQNQDDAGPVPGKTGRGGPRLEAASIAGKDGKPAAGPSLHPEQAPVPGKWRRRWDSLMQAALAPLKLLTNRPSNERDWSEDVSVLPEAIIVGDKLTVRNVRDFDYKSTKEWTARWEDRTYDLREVQSVWFAVEPFGSFTGPAHTFLSFGFKDGRYLAVSVEIRRVKGDRFSPWRGLFNGFELTYVVGDERDLVRLRANHRKSDVFLYPIKASGDLARSLLVDMLGRANALRAKPEFYNTLTKTCTTTILAHVRKLAPRRFPLSWKVLLPAYSDRLAYDLGLIDFEGTFEDARRRFKINDRAAAADKDPRFSHLIR